MKLTHDDTAVNVTWLRLPGNSSLEVTSLNACDNRASRPFRVRSKTAAHGGEIKDGATLQTTAYDGPICKHASTPSMPASAAEYNASMTS
jgi:hypothetical protein